MKKRIADLAYTIIYSDILRKYDLGELQAVAALDMDNIVKEFNNGNYSVLDNKNIDLFVRNGERAWDILNFIMYLKELVSCKKDFNQDVIEKKDAMTYNPEETYCHLNYYCQVDVSYMQVAQGIEIAEKLLKDETIYKVLRFYLKYESLITQIQEQKNAYKDGEHNGSSKEILLDFLKTPDEEVGIVRVDDSKKGVKVYAGTKRDMALSDLIGRPYEADRDEPGYDYGPHGDFWMPPRKVVKTFHKNGDTALHAEMIKAEKEKRARLSTESSEELGFIRCHLGVVFITKKELAEVGVCPDEIDWKPLRLEVKPESITDLCKIGDRYVSLRDKIGMKKELLMKGRQKKRTL